MTTMTTTTSNATVLVDGVRLQTRHVIAGIKRERDVPYYLNDTEPIEPGEVWGYYLRLLARREYGPNAGVSTRLDSWTPSGKIERYEATLHGATDRRSGMHPIRNVWVTFDRDELDEAAAACNAYRAERKAV